MSKRYQDTYRIHIEGMIDDQTINTTMEFASADKGQVIELIKGRFTDMKPCTLTDIYGSLLLINPALIRLCVLKITDVSNDINT